MYATILHIHSILRWVIIVLSIAVVIDYWMGLFSKRKFSSLDNRLSLFYIIALDTQLLFGLSLYFFLSPNVHLSGLDMSDAAARYYSVEHPAMMLLAIIMAHVGRVMVKKATIDTKKFQRGVIFFMISLVLIFVGIKW